VTHQCVIRAKPPFLSPAPRPLSSSLCAAPPPSALSRHHTHVLLGLHQLPAPPLHPRLSPAAKAAPLTAAPSPTVGPAIVHTDDESPPPQTLQSLTPTLSVTVTIGANPSSSSTAAPRHRLAPPAPHRLCHRLSPSPLPPFPRRTPPIQNPNHHLCWLAKRRKKNVVLDQASTGRVLSAQRDRSYCSLFVLSGLCLAVWSDDPTVLASSKPS
jgi:hypothetical protein